MVTVNARAGCFGLAQNEHVQNTCFTYTPTIAIFTPRPNALTPIGSRLLCFHRDYQVDGFAIGWKNDATGPIISGRVGNLCVEIKNSQVGR